MEQQPHILTFYQRGMLEFISRRTGRDVPSLLDDALQKLRSSIPEADEWDETAYLMSSMSNAARLNQSIDDIENGKHFPHKLIED